MVINCVAMNWKGLPSPAIDSMGNMRKAIRDPLSVTGPVVRFLEDVRKGRFISSQIHRGLNISGECGSAITV